MFVFYVDLIVFFVINFKFKSIMLLGFFFTFEKKFKFIRSVRFINNGGMLCEKSGKYLYLIVCLHLSVLVFVMITYFQCRNSVMLC
jgi:hypothetical protein